MRNLLSLIATLGLVGCVGGIEDPGPTDPGPTDPGPEDPANPGAAAEAKRLYEDNVYDIVKAKCIACHSAAGPVSNTTGFVDPNKPTAHATVLGYQAAMGDYTFAGAPIVTMITGTTKTPNHVSLEYTPDEQAKFTAWLEKELEAKVGGGPTDPQNPPTETPAAATVRLMKEWSGCMKLADFTAANMTAWGNVNAGGGGQCKTCHALGEFGHIASNTAEPNFFKYITEDKYYMLQYFSVDLSLGVAQAKVIINTRSFEGVGNRLTPHESHPGFNPLNNNGMEALEEFYGLAMAHKTAGTCDPPRLLN